MIYKEKDETTINIPIEYSNNKLRPNKIFLQQLGTILMKKSNNESKAKRRMLIQSNII